ncbi:HutD family protein [Nocardioides sp. NPDC047086]|uniref:HutD/Ves family protein n=1 Tax=Nocardioides sp. NPDC047086 TaxID=3154810 RepID=UPI003410CE69
MAFDLRRAEEHVRRSWRNGGGMTAEVAAWPPGTDAGSDFSWRVSFADVAESGDFSTFPGVDRVITLIDGPPMTLELLGETTVLRPFVPYSFDGGVPVRCSVAAPTRDLNVMTRRGRACATVEILDAGSGEQPLSQASPLLVIGLTGEVGACSGDDSATLGSGDVLITDQPVTVEGAGVAAVVRIASGPSGIQD